MPFSLIAAQPADGFDLAAFLESVDLTVSGVDDPRVKLWMQLDSDGRIEATTGFESIGSHALIRSVAVHPRLRRIGLGRQLAQFALQRAAEEGATTAWLFSRRSPEFWSRLGFEQTGAEELRAVLGGTYQVRNFIETGQLVREVAWTRSLAPGAHYGAGSVE